MDTITFNNMVLDTVNSRLPEDTEASLMTVTKNNSVLMDGIVIKNEKDTVSPTIYLNAYHDDYENDLLSIDEVADNIIKTYRGHMSDMDSSDITSWFMDFDKVKEQVVYRVVNYALNEEFLKDVPHRRFLDLAVTFHVMVSIHNDDDASILIHNQHLEGWGADAEELMEYAKINTPRLLPTEICSMSSLLSKMMGEEADNDQDMDSMMPMYVLTNRLKMNGAHTVLDKDSLSELAERLEDDLILIPSSVHEWIAVPAGMSGTAGEMAQMIREVNATQLGPHEVLSNHPYRFGRYTGTVTCF